jgi:hypothetical protein
MNGRPWLIFLLAGLGWLGTVARITAQSDIDQKRNVSHAPIGSPVLGPDQAREFLAAHLRRAHDLADLQKNLPALEKLAHDIVGNPEKFGLTGKDKDLLKGGLNLDDPRWRNVLQRVLENQQRSKGGFEVSPEQLQAWGKLLDPAGQGPGINPDRPLNPTPGGPPPMPGQPPNGPPGQPFGPPRFQPPNLPLPPPPQTQSWINSERLSSWAERLRRLDTVQNSDTLKKAVRDLSRQLMAQGEIAASGDSPRSVSEYFHLDRYWPHDGWRPNGSWLPRINPGAFQPPTGLSGPGPASISTGSTSAWETVLWVLLFAVLGVAAWRLLVWRQAQLRAAVAAWKLGPWPVDPAAVATPQELILAFEYLSLLRFGQAAFTWNHLEIAAHLAEGEAEPTEQRQAAARRLAALYEQARYAPLVGPLPDADLASARRDLCFLAGASASVSA